MNQTGEHNFRAYVIGTQILLGLAATATATARVERGVRAMLEGVDKTAQGVGESILSGLTRLVGSITPFS